MIFPREAGAFGMTKRLSVRYLRPVQPVPGVFKMLVDCASLDEQRGEMKVRASLLPPTSPFLECSSERASIAAPGSKDSQERPYAVAEVELVDIRRRKRWKAAYRNKTAGVEISRL